MNQLEIKNFCFDLMSEEIIFVPNSESILTVFGACDRHLRRIADALNVRIWSCRREIHIAGAPEQVQKAQYIIRQALSRPFVSDDDVSCLLNEAQYSECAPTNYASPRFSLPASPFPDSFQESQAVPTAFDFSPNALPKADKFNYSFMEKDMEKDTESLFTRKYNNALADSQLFDESDTTDNSRENYRKGLFNDENIDAKNDANRNNEGSGGVTKADIDSPIEVRPLDVFTGRKIRPRTAGQARFLRALQTNELTFCSGPAGSGKTYLAVAAAVAAMKAGTVERIMLVRPAVEAGESLGFLPGDLRAKINPYLRPLFDALRDMMDPMSIKRLTEEDIIEVIPLAYMRGRTFNSAYIILDEAQNTTVSQMKMFLTRMGEYSRVVVSGDVTQIDLPPRTESGLVDALKRLKGIRNIAMVQMSAADIVRHKLVQRIVNAYEGIQ